MSEMCPSLSVPTLNVSGLNSPGKRYILAEWIKKKIESNYLLDLQDTHFKYKDAHKLKVKGLKKIFHANITKREQGWLD